RAKSKQDRSQQIRGCANYEIANAGDNGAEGTDEVLHRPIRWREITPRHPGGQVLWIVGNEREKDQRPYEEQNEGEDFVPGAILYAAGHFGRIVISKWPLSINSCSCFRLARHGK